jgi:hypothetical protein
MSLPCAGNPKYKVCTEEKIRASLCPGKMIDGVPVFTCDADAKVKVIDHSANCAAVDYPIGLRADYQITADGVTVNVTGDGHILHMLPTFAFDGEKDTIISLDDNALQIEYEGYICQYTSNGKIRDLGRTARNRNGFYRLFYAEADKSLTINICILKI